MTQLQIKPLTFTKRDVDWVAVTPFGTHAYIYNNDSCSWFAWEAHKEHSYSPDKVSVRCKDFNDALRCANEWYAKLVRECLE